MGQQVIYRCIECGKYFRSTDDNVLLFEECQCLGCGEIKGAKELEGSVVTENYKPFEKSIGKCNMCGEELRSKIVAQCPKCQSKRVKVEGTIGSL